MRRRTTTVSLFIALALVALPIAAQPLFTVVGAALIELIDIGKSSGVIGHKDDAVLVFGDATDDEVQIKAGLSDPISLWVNQNLLATTVWPSGIVDLNLQSRARWSLSVVQPVPQATWTPIEFDFDPTLTDPDHFDAQIESVPGAPGVPWTFVATEAGYYQVNARTEFTNPRPDDPDISELPIPAAAPPPGPALGVSIAIFKTDPTGVFAIHSQGNNLQYLVFAIVPPGQPLEILLEANNAPNVSDVVYLAAGGMIQIHAWWDVGGAGPWLADLVAGKHKTYVSVHKIS